MEVERVKFLLKSYLRTRIAKIERHLIFLIEKEQGALMSQAEQELALALFTMRKEHFERSLLNKVPSELNEFEKEQMSDRLGKCTASTA